MMNVCFKVGLIFFLVLSFSTSDAQAVEDVFGQNRIQYKNFDWKFYSTENFEVYFYAGGENAAKLSADYLEEEFERVTDLLGFPTYNKTKVFLYNSIADLQQSNVGVSSTFYSVGGQTNFTKPLVQIAHPGTNHELKEELLYQMSKVFINEMMFGGNLAESLQSSYLLSLPTWFTEGASRYLSKEWDEEMDDFVRDLFVDKKFKRLSKYSGKSAELIGQSIWNFIVEKYGRANISNILNLTRIIRNEQSGIANSLGISFKQVLLEWENYYTGMGQQVEDSYVKPDAALKLKSKNKKHLLYKSAKISPDGKHLAFSQNNRGKYKVFVKNIETGQQRLILVGGYRVVKQNIDQNIPLLDWQNDETLGVITTQFGLYNLWLYGINAKSKVKYPLDNFDQIKDFDFSSGGNLFVMSVDVKGQNDIYIYSVTRFSQKRLTNDIYDDLNPRFIPNSNGIVFSSNRTSDTLKNVGIGLKDLDQKFSLFTYNLDTTKGVLGRLSNTISMDIKPIPKNDSIFYYLSDQKGVTNIYQYDASSEIYKQVSNYNTGVKSFDINFDANKMALIMNEGEDNFIYLDDSPELTKSKFTPLTFRKQMEQAKFVQNRIIERENRLNKLKPDGDPFAYLYNDSTSNNNFESVDTLNSSGEFESLTDIIDTENYVFERDVQEPDELVTAESFLNAYRNLGAKKEVQGPYQYESEFSADNFTTTWLIDPMTGFGIQLGAQMNDILENHLFDGSIFFTDDLLSGKTFAEYKYLKNRIDFSARYDRTGINLIETEDSDPLEHKYVLNKIQLGASLPISVKTRVSINPFYGNTRFFEVAPIPGSTVPSSLESKFDYGGIKSELVYDNTIIHDLNLLNGTQARVSLEQYWNLNGNTNMDFSNLQIDVRHYQKLHKNLVFAVRGFYGNYFGNQSQNYVLGGVNNFVTTKRRDGKVEPLAVENGTDNSNLLFVQFATNLRGFDYNHLNGSNVLLANAELRWPIVRYFHKGAIGSNFLRNLSVIGFYDIGSAWTNSSPFSNDNDLNTKVVEKGSFRATIKDFSNPWLSSYGWGVRTVLLGYYIKTDVAWAVDNFKTSSPRFLVSLGYDF